ncbi:PREDICTED: uncharacterized protein LOC106314889 [Brassica oleracea var. oleracea]|uniref:uncharacterized protein LOC106314889 n=1 Tax=Brassica oleracea var. oleracea TaxID=109376 RepID=UPI0006A6AD97|nr:PREDICTED: uncharacterized protein LOC106314889 [Brassica oleracea var. oleracea]
MVVEVVTREEEMVVDIVEVEDVRVRDTEVQCSPKLNHFLWKFKTNALAVGEMLIKWGIQVDGKCKICGSIEYVLHAMLTCPFAQKVWKLAPVKYGPNCNPDQSMGEVLDVCLKTVNLPPSGLVTPLYPWIFWVLWTSRNQLLFEDKSFSETYTMLRAIKAAK